MRITSPDKNLVLAVITESGQLRWSVAAGRTAVIESSALGIVIDGNDLGKGAVIRGTESYRIDDSFPWRGATSEIKYRAAGTRINVNHPPSRTDYTIDVRVSNDCGGGAIRRPGTGSRVPTPQ